MLYHYIVYHYTALCHVVNALHIDFTETFRGIPGVKKRASQLLRLSKANQRLDFCLEYCDLSLLLVTKEFIPSLIGYTALKHAQNMLPSCDSGC